MVAPFGPGNRSLVSARSGLSTCRRRIVARATVAVFRGRVCRRCVWSVRLPSGLRAVHLLQILRVPGPTLCGVSHQLASRRSKRGARASQPVVRGASLHPRCVIPDRSLCACACVRVLVRAECASEGARMRVRAFMNAFRCAGVLCVLCECVCACVRECVTVRSGFFKLLCVCRV